MSIQSGLFKDLQARGLIYQVTSPDLEKALDERSMTVYQGIDPTGDALHVGHLVGVVTLMRFQRYGHHTVSLVGGATGSIGDPSGKSQERSLLSREQLELNIQGIRKSLSKFLKFDGPYPTRLVNNDDWFRGIGFIDFLRDVGKHFTVNHMMAKESVRARLEDRDQGISYTEMSYMLLQAYDFYHLHKEMNCNIQFGGSDQWGNITAGTDLIQKKFAAVNDAQTPRPAVFGITHPLITRPDGKKFGKSETGTVWLEADRTSPYELYQFFLRTPDGNVIPFLKYFTFVSLDEIAQIELAHLEKPEALTAQKRLAEEVLRLVHGEDALQEATRATQALFSGGDLTGLGENQILQAFSGAPSETIAADRLSGEGLLVIDLLVESKLCASRGMAKKDLESGGIYVNQGRVSDASVRLKSTDLIHGKYLVLRKGKKNYFLFQVSPGEKL